MHICQLEYHKNQKPHHKFTEIRNACLVFFCILIRHAHSFNFFEGQYKLKIIMVVLWSYQHHQVPSIYIWTAGQKIWKSPGKKLMKSTKLISWNCIFGSLKLFPSSKIDFLAIFEVAKNGIWPIKNFVKSIYLISWVFLAWTF